MCLVKYLLAKIKCFQSKGSLIAFPVLKNAQLSFGSIAKNAKNEKENNNWNKSEVFFINVTMVTSNRLFFYSFVGTGRS